jgi:hypothetical protein
MGFILSAFVKYAGYPKVVVAAFLEFGVTASRSGLGQAIVMHRGWWKSVHIFGIEHIESFKR